MALGVCGEVAAGVRYSVDFMEGVGEVGYTRRHATTVLEGTVKSYRQCIEFSSLIQARFTKRLEIALMIDRHNHSTI